MTSRRNGFFVMMSVFCAGGSERMFAFGHHEVFAALVLMVVFTSGCNTPSPRSRDAGVTRDGEVIDRDAEDEIADSGSRDAAGARSPLYVYMFDHTEDHINVGEGETLGYCEARWYRLVELLRRLRSDYPDATLDGGPWASLQFHGAEAQSVADRNDLTAAASGANEIGLRDLLRNALSDGLIDLGYHGAHEPTYDNNVYSALEPGELETLSFADQTRLAEQYLSCWRDPYYGVGPDDCEVGPGGALEVLRVFFDGEAGTPGLLVVSGVPGAQLPAGDIVLDRYANGALRFGFDDHSGNGKGDVIGKTADYYDSVEQLLAHLTTGDGTVYGLYQVNGRVTTGFLGDRERALGKWTPSQGVADLEERLPLLPVDQPYLMKIHLATKYLYTFRGGHPDCSSPTQWAYAHPTTPKLPPECIHTEAHQEQYWTDLEAGLRYLIEEVFPTRPGSAFITPSSILRHVELNADLAVSADMLREAAEQVLADAGELPLYVNVDGHFLALNEVFQLLASALASEAIPEIQEVPTIRATTSFVTPPSATVELSAAQVRDMAATLSRRFGLEVDDPDRLFGPPANVQLADGSIVATSGALRAMAQAYISLFDTGSVPDGLDAADTPVTNQDAYRAAWCSSGMMGCEWASRLWALKPARWR